MTITPKTVTEEPFENYFYNLMRGQYPINGVTFEGYSENFYSDTRGIPTVGTGTALIFKSDNTYQVRGDLSAVFSGAYTFSSAEQTTLSTIVSQLNAQNVSDAETTLNNAKSGGQFVDLSSSEVRTVFDNALNTNLTTVQNTHGVAWANIQSSLAGTYELAAVYSLLYALPDLVGNGLMDALSDGDRARSWYEILYNHQEYNDSVTMNRRESEADLFSLVDDGADPKEIALELNTLFNGEDASSNNIYDRIQSRDTYKPFEDKIAEYLEDVQDYYANGNTIDFIQIADDQWIVGGTIDAKAASGKTDSNTSNLIIGSDANDIIDGKGGNDFLIGGAGYDDLYGGEGFDTANYSTSTDAIHAYIGNGPTYDVVYDGILVNGYDSDDYLFSIEKIIGSDANDNFDIYSSYFTGIEIDGGAGDDTVTYKEDISYDARNGGDSIWAGVGQATLAGIENISADGMVSIILDHTVSFSQSWLNSADPIIANSSDVILDYSAATSALTFNFDSGSNNDIVIAGGSLSHSFSSDVKAIRGSQFGDTFNTDYITWTKEIYTGAGNDVVNMQAAAFEDYRIHYSGGNDTYNLTQNLKDIYLADTIILSDIAIGALSSSGAGQFSVDLTITNHGTLSINYDDYALNEIKIYLETGGLISIENAWVSGQFTGWQLSQSGSSSTATSHDGTWGIDTWEGRSGFSETYKGYGGDDVITGGDGNDIIYGGADVDTAKYIGNYANYTITDQGTFWGVIDNVASEGSDKLYGVEFIEFADGTFNVSNQVFDSIASIIDGTTGNDTLTGTAGDDTINGLAGNDTLIGGAGDDALDGGDGSDTADYSAATSKVTAQLINGTASNDGQGGSDTFTSIENLIGSAYADVLWGDANDNTIDGGAGNDKIYVRDGVNIIDGGANNDTINVLNSNTASNTLYGGSGRDTFIMGSFGDSVIDGGTGNDTLTYAYLYTAINLNAETGSVDKDGDGITDDTFTNIKTLTGSRVDDTLTGSTGTDFLNGNSGDDIISGGGGTDYLKGDNGNDTIYGGDGNDVLYGGNGDDIIYGGNGNDQIWGHAGADTFVFENATAFNDTERVNDFSLSDNDKLDISDLLAAYDPLNDALIDFVQITDSGVNSIVSVDADGGADNFIEVARLLHITGLTDEVALEASGHLVVAQNSIAQINQAALKIQNKFSKRVFLHHYIAMR